MVAKQKIYCVLFSFITRQKNNFVFFIVVCCVLIGLICLMYFWSNPLESDEVNYFAIGKNICQLHRFSEDTDMGQQITMSRPPLYPLIISFFYCLKPNPNLIRILQLLIYTSCVLLVYQIAKISFNQKTAKTAAFFLAVWPPFFFLIGLLFTELVFIFFLLIALYYLILFYRRQKYFFLGGSSVFFALATLTRPIFLFFPIFFFGALILLKRTQFHHIVKKGFIFLGIFYLIISPWLFRNYYIFKEFNISDTGSVTLYNRAYRLQYYDLADVKHYFLTGIFGSYLTKKIDPSYDYNFQKFEPHAFRRSEQWPIKDNFDFQSNPIEGKKILYQEAKSIILNHPLKYFGFSVFELIRLHTPLISEFDATNLFTGNHSSMPEIIKICLILILRLSYSIFFLLVVYGMIKSSQEKKITQPIILVVVYILLFLCLMDTIPRYSLPLYPLYFIFFAYGLYLLISNRLKKNNVLFQN